MTDHTADRVFLDRLIRLREEYGNRPTCCQRVARG